MMGAQSAVRRKLSPQSSGKSLFWTSPECKTLPEVVLQDGAEQYYIDSEVHSSTALSTNLLICFHLNA